MQLKAPQHPHVNTLHNVKFQLICRDGALPVSPPRPPGGFVMVVLPQAFQYQNKCIQTALHPEPVFPQSSASPTVSRGGKKPQGVNQSFIRICWDFNSG